VKFCFDFQVYFPNGNSKCSWVHQETDLSFNWGVKSDHPSRICFLLKINGLRFPFKWVSQEFIRHAQLLIKSHRKIESGFLVRLLRCLLIFVSTVTAWITDLSCRWSGGRQVLSPFGCKYVTGLRGWLRPGFDSSLYVG
jgi:hypothetical protein